MKKNDHGDRDLIMVRWSRRCGRVQRQPQLKGRDMSIRLVLIQRTSFYFKLIRIIGSWIHFSSFRISSSTSIYKGFKNSLAAIVFYAIPWHP